MIDYNEETKLKMVYVEAYNFLKNKTRENNIDEEILQEQLDYYYKCKQDSINDIFKHMVSSLKNKQGASNYIVDINQMKSILCDFEPKNVLKKYGVNWEFLFVDFKKKFGQEHKMEVQNPRNAWVQFSKGVLSCSRFLSNFDSIDEFDDFVNEFSDNEFTIAALPMLLEKEIFGLGFALSCDFLKETGYVNYGKPDIHLKDIFFGLNLVEFENDYEVFKTIVKMGKAAGEDPVIVDKVFWLIGSGKFDIGCEPQKIGSNKKEFINLINKKINNENNSALTGT